MAFDPSIGRATQFRKGQSGNAGGRPKSRLLSEALRNRLADRQAGRSYRPHLCRSDRDESGSYRVLKVAKRGVGGERDC